MINLHRLIILLVCAPLIAEPAKDDSRLKVKFRAISLQEPIEGFGYLQGNDFRTFELRDDSFSRTQDYVGPNPLRLATLTKIKEEPRPGILQAQAQLEKAEASMSVINRKISEIQIRLQPLLGAINEHGDSTPARVRGEANVLKQELDELNIAMAKLDQLAQQAREFINQPTEDTEPGPKTAKRTERRQNTPVGEVSFPGSGRYLLLLSRTSQGIHASVLDDKPGAFPFGTLQFLNLSMKTVEIRFGDERAVLKPGSKGVIRPSTFRSNYAKGGVYSLESDSAVLGSTIRVLKDDARRILFFILPNEGSPAGLNLKAIEQRQTPEDILPEPAEMKKKGG